MKGRKSKYTKETSEQLIQHMNNGRSYTSFAVLIGVHVDTLYEWEKKYPEFSEAKKMAFSNSQSFWEDIGLKMAIGGNFNAWKFNMINRFGWKNDHPDKNPEHVEYELVYKKPEKVQIELNYNEMNL